MNTIGDITDGHILFFTLGLEEIPHFAGDMAVQFGDSIGAFGKFERQHGHDKDFTPGLSLACQGQ